MLGGRSPAPRPPLPTGWFTALVSPRRPGLLFRVPIARPEKIIIWRPCRRFAGTGHASPDFLTSRIAANLGGPWRTTMESRFNRFILLAILLLLAVIAMRPYVLEQLYWST